MSAVSCRIAFFTPSLGGGGAERVVVTLASHYVAQGHAVDLIVSRREDTYLKEVHPKVRIHYLHTQEFVNSGSAIGIRLSIG